MAITDSAISTVTVERMDDIMPLIKECLENSQSVRFSPRGVSMLPMLRQGRDTVTLSPISGELKKYDIALYVRANGKHVLHRVIETGVNYTCIGDNQYYCEKGLSREQFIGVVTSFSRDKREYTVDNFGYKLYCRVWHYSRTVRHFASRVRRKLSKIMKIGADKQ